MPTSNDHKANSAKGGRIGGPKSPTNFRNNPNLASEAGKKSKRGPNKIRCDWCGDEIQKGTLVQHAKVEHPNLYKKFFEGNEEAQKNAEL